jgi:hypothetical protein
MKKDLKINLWDDPRTLNPWASNENSDCTTISTWFSGDNEETYRKNKLKSVLKTYFSNDFSYSLNSLGFRSEEFVNQTDIKILYAGCSVTHGTGLPLEHTWHGILNSFISKEISKPIKTFNLGIPGAGIDAIVRSVYITIEHGQFIPNMVCVLLPSVMRKEIIIETQTNVVNVNYIPGLSTNPNKIIAEFIELQDKLISYRQQYNDCFKNLLFLKYFLKTKNIPFAFGCWDDGLSEREILHALALTDSYTESTDMPKELMEHYCPGCFVWDSFYNNKDAVHPGHLDTFDIVYPYNIARDYGHFGPNSHYNFSKNLYKYLLNKSFFNELMSKWKQ